MKKLTKDQKQAIAAIRKMWRCGYTRNYIKFLVEFVIEDYERFCKSKFSLGII